MSVCVCVLVWFGNVCMYGGLGFIFAILDVVFFEFRNKNKNKRKKMIHKLQMNQIFNFNSFNSFFFLTIFISITKILIYQ